MASLESKPRSGPPSDEINWYDAWQFSSIGPAGFWHRERPAAHFRTASGATGLVARMLLTLLADHPEISTIVDIGAGDGRLLTEIAALAPGMRLIGLDLRPAPIRSSVSPGPSSSTSGSTQRSTPRSLAWRQGQWNVDAQAWLPAGRSGRQPVPLRTVLPAGQPAAIVAAEWLDELPMVVAERGPDRWRHVQVSPDGAEGPGAPVPAADAEWLDRWWPGVPGARAESGRTRDRAWQEIIDCLSPAGGLAIMIDYGHCLPDRPAGGTLTGFQYGRQVPPKPSPTINLTAHVAVDSVQQAGEESGARTELLFTQREAVERLLPTPLAPDRSPDGALARLQTAGERRLLADTLGDHWWLVQSVTRESHGAR